MKEKDREKMINELAGIAFKFGEKNKLDSIHLCAAWMGTLLSICRELEISPEIVSMMMDTNKNVYARWLNDKS